MYSQSKDDDMCSPAVWNIMSEIPNDYSGHSWASSHYNDTKYMLTHKTGSLNWAFPKLWETVHTWNMRNCAYKKLCYMRNCVMRWVVLQFAINLVGNFCKTVAPSSVIYSLKLTFNYCSQLYHLSVWKDCQFSSFFGNNPNQAISFFFFFVHLELSLLYF